MFNNIYIISAYTYISYIIWFNIKYASSTEVRSMFSYNYHRINVNTKVRKFMP
jgi:hypothetical protein